MESEPTYQKDLPQPRIFHSTAVRHGFNATFGDRSFDFDLLMQPVLGNKQPFIVVVVLSHASEFEKRKVIRETWASKAVLLSMHVIFVLGSSPTVKFEQITKEAQLFGDLLMANFVDSYRNLTLKTYSALLWISNLIKKPKFVFKTDSDVLVFPDKLDKFARSKLIRNDTIYGHLWHNVSVVREAHHKWFVNSSAYSPGFWPDYISGPAYLMSYDVIKRLISSASELPFFEVEDIYFTGVLAEYAGVRRKLAAEFEPNRRTCLNVCVTGHVISSHGYSTSELSELWDSNSDRRSCDLIDRILSMFC